MTAVGTGRTQCWLQAVSGCYLSIYLSIACTSNTSVYNVASCDLFSSEFLSLFLSPSTVHCYTCFGCTYSLNPPPLCPLLSTMSHTPFPSVWTSFMDDPCRVSADHTVLSDSVADDNSDDDKLTSVYFPSLSFLWTGSTSTPDCLKLIRPIRASMTCEFPCK